MTAIWLLIILVPHISRLHGSKREREPLDRIEKYLPTPPPGLEEDAKGKVKVKKDKSYLFAGAFSQGNYCLDTLGGKYGSSIGMFQCTGIGGNQLWLLKGSGLLQSKKLCLEALDTTNVVYLEKCTGGGSQTWDFIDQMLTIAGSDRCIASNEKKDVVVQKCDVNNKHHKWHAKPKF